MGIRRHMDYGTGMVGLSRCVSYQSLIEMLDPTDVTTSPEKPATRRELQRAFEALERVGLVRWIRGNMQRKGLVFECLLATRNQSERKEVVQKRCRSGADEAVQAESSNYAASERVAVPNSVAVQQGEAVPPQVIRIQDKKEEEERGEKTAKARGARLSLCALPSDWRAWCEIERPDLNPDQVWEMFSDYWTAKSGSAATKVDWFATWRNWVRRERQAPMSRAKRIAENNKAAGDEWERGEKVIEGKCRVVK